MKDWVGVGEAYSASYAALCAGTFPLLQAALGAAHGRTLLDVGSGDGTLADAWATAGWMVTACEPEPSMRAVSSARHPRVRVLDGALPGLPFADGSFDVVIANFVLNHVATPRTAAAELRRVARSAVAATTWTLSPSWLWAEVTRRAVLAPLAGQRLPESEDFERTAEGFEGMLRDAGWRGVGVVEHTWTWTVAPDVLWASVEGGVAGAGALYAALDTEERQRFRRAFDEVVDERLVDGVLPLEHRAAIASCSLL
ncbi:class I SAM-dependent methyltransferase [Microbacterium sp. LB12]|uniref:class I SAM-dependent methyltransferase n=1 Tax=Microbacterium sp. LB12 TaxID=3081270 RepID=UPI00301A4A79